jgi:hypothetical protein
MAHCFLATLNKSQCCGNQACLGSLPALIGESKAKVIDFGTWDSTINALTILRDAVTAAVNRCATQNRFHLLYT